MKRQLIDRRTVKRHEWLRYLADNGPSSYAISPRAAHAARTFGWTQWIGSLEMLTPLGEEKLAEWDNQP